MYTHILISTDGSDVARKGVDHGLSLAKNLGAKVTIVTATEPFSFQASTAGAGWVPTSADIAGYEEAQKEFASKILTTVKEAAGKLGVEAEVLHVPDARPGRSDRRDGADCGAYCSAARRRTCLRTAPFRCLSQGAPARTTLETGAVAITSDLRAADNLPRPQQRNRGRERYFGVEAIGRRSSCAGA